MWICPLTLRKRDPRREGGDQEAEVVREEGNADLDLGPATRRVGGRRGGGGTRAAETGTMTGDAGDTRSAETPALAPTLTDPAGGAGGEEVMTMTLSRRRTGTDVKRAVKGGAGRRQARPLRRL